MAKSQTKSQENKKSQLETHNDWLIAHQNKYADNINALYRDGIEYSYYPVIREENKVPWFEIAEGEKIQ
jgi:hypothetical protein